MINLKKTYEIININYYTIYSIDLSLEIYENLEDIDIFEQALHYIFNTITDVKK